MRAAALIAALGATLATAGAAGEAWVTAPGAGISAARFEVPDDSYPHRIMGTIPERRVLAVRDAAGREMRLDLRDGPDPDHVFEDIAPRVVDADGDGQNDVVLVESSPRHGAQLAVYTLRRGDLVKSAATPHIGTRFRWLAPPRSPISMATGSPISPMSRRRIWARPCASGAGPPVALRRSPICAA